MEKDELITRRELFKRASKVLPIIALSTLPHIEIAARVINDCNQSCANGCRKSCVDSCARRCNGTCADVCTSCSVTCRGGCKTFCGSACDGKCIGLCHSTCKHSATSTIKNDTIIIKGSIK